MNSNPVKPPATSASPVRSIDAELLYAGFDQTRSMLAFTIAAVIVFAVLFWDFFPSNIATAWVIAMFAILAVRAGIWVAFQRAQPEGDQIGRWQLIFTLQTGLGGAAWGIGAAAMLPATAGAEMAVLVGGMLCVTAVSLSALAAQQPALRLFATGTLAPLAVAAWMIGGDLPHMVALILVTGLVVTIYVGSRANLAVRALFEAKIDASRIKVDAVARESEERYRNLVEWSPEPMCVNRDGVIVYVNPATIKLFGATREEELLGRHAIDLVHPDFRELASERRATVEAGHASVVPMRELTFLRLDGSPIQCEAQGLLVMFDGKPAIQVAMRDITPRKQAESELARSRQRLEQLVSGAGVGLWEWEYETNYVYFSPQWKANLGYQDDEIANDFEVFRSHMHPDDLPAVNAAIEEFRNGTRPKYEVEFRMRHRDGGWRWLFSQASIIADEHGKAVRMVGSHVDVTQRRRDEAALRENEVRLRLALRGGDLGLWDWNAATGKMTVNERWMTMLGLDPEGHEPSIEDWHARVHPEDMPKLDKLVSDMHRDVQMVDFEAEIRARRTDGRIIWILDKGVIASRDGEGQPTRIVGTHMDITERKEAELARQSLESQLRESQKMQAIGTLAGGVAHDFNNIIAAILGNTELARLDSQDPRVLESLAEIQRAGSRGRDLVRQILSFSRRQPIEKQLVELPAVVDESVKLLRATLPARLKLTSHVAEKLPAVWADATQLEQVVINLASNAMHAIPSGTGLIDIRLDRVQLDESMLAAPSVNGALRKLYDKNPGQVLRLSVTDSGSGMDSETLNRIFEPFFTTKQVDEGTGLGLSVVLGIVESHDGAVVVSSEVGKGTTFTLYLPTAAVTSIAGPLAPSITGPRRAITKPTTVTVAPSKKILYLDDDAAMVYLVARLLERRGISVVAFSDQEEALGALAASPADFGLVVTDYNMPGMSGIDVVARVKAIRPDLPVAIASGFIDETLRDRASNAGVAELIFKANVADDFCSAISRLARQSQA